jgi:murein L,D-transpeptidase YcbB/YkuD
VLALALLLTVGSVAADLRATLSPFAGTDEPAAEPRAIVVGEREVDPFSLRLLAELYATRDYQAAWDSRRARAMLELAHKGREDGFVPADFHAGDIAAIIDNGDLQSTDPSRRDNAELLLSDALLRYVHHFRFGKHNPERVNRGQTFVEPADAEQLTADMAEALAAADMAAVLAARLPSPDFYRNLKKGYQRYLAIADRGGWDDIPGGRNLSVGATDPRVPLIREHLEVIDGYDPGFVAEPQRYDEALAEAVKGFQRRSGLSADGVVGPNTLRALNQPLDQRLLAIRANLERMRWLYNDLPSDYLFVDLTGFELYLVRDHEEVWRTRGIIGTVENQTPMFRDEMEHLVFNPTWTVPRSIEKKFKGVPAGYKRVRSGGQYYLVQQPGPRNALGRVKFMFPNGHAIYLHDTPSRHLFSRSNRAYSHGCVRVHEPLTLAQHVLNRPGWSEAEINRVVRRGSTRWVHLEDHLPVLLYYLTAFADDAGRVGFRRDIYNRDRRLLAALDNPVDGAERIAFAEPEPEPEETLDEAAGEAVADSASGADAAAGADETDVAVGTDPATAAADAVADTASAETGASASTDGEADAAAIDAAPADRLAGEPAMADDASAAGADDAATDGALGEAATSLSAAEPAVVQEDADAESPVRPAAEQRPPAGVAQEADDRPTASERPPETVSSPTTRMIVPAPDAPTTELRLDDQGRFRAADAVVVPPGAPRLERARLDLSAPKPVLTTPRVMSSEAPGVGSPSAAGDVRSAAQPIQAAPRVADEPSVWTLPRD